MRPVLTSLLVLTALLHASCGTCTSTQGASGPGADVLAEASSGALLGVVVVPERWPRLAEVLEPHRAHLPADLRGELPPLPTPHALTATILGARGWGALLEPAPAGLDASRPFALGWVVGAEDALATIERLAKARPGEGQRGVRTRLVLPATDPAALAQALEARCASAGFAPMRGPELPGSERLCAVFPEAGRVRVELVDDDRPSSDLAAWRAAWLARVSPDPEPAPSSVARDHASRQAAIGLHLDLRRLRDAGAAQGSATIAAALAEIEPDLARRLLPVGLGEVLAGYDLLSPSRALTAEVGLALDVERGLTLRAVSLLTERGAELLAAARAEAGPHLVAEGAPAVALSLDLSLRKLLADPPWSPPAGADSAKGSRALARALEEKIQRCGFTCTLGTGLDPRVIATLLTAELPPNTLAAAPRSAALALVPTPDAGRDFPVALTLALGDGPSGELAGLMKGLVGDAPGESPAALEQATSTRVEGATIVRFAVGPVDRRPRLVEDAAAPGELFSGRVELAGLGELLAWGLRRGDPLGAILPALGTARVRVVLREGVLASVLALTPPGAQADEPQAPAISVAPVAAPPDDEASRCLERAVDGLATALQVGEQVSPEQAPLAIARAQVEAEPHLRCAEADSRTQVDAARLRAIAAALLPPLPRP